MKSFWKPKPSKNKFNINLNIYPKRTKKELELVDKNPFEDADKDKVPNWFDCKPLNRKKQAWEPVKKKREEAFKVEWMRPKTYLRKTKLDPFSKKPEKAEKARIYLKKFYDVSTGKMQDINVLAGYIKEPKVKVSLPFIGEGSWLGETQHEGRHRAYAAFIAGKTKIPVIVVTPKEWKSKEIVEEFIKKAFSHELDEDYKEEWRQRFKGPFPQDKMDPYRVKIYYNILKERGLIGTQKSRTSFKIKEEKTLNPEIKKVMNFYLHQVPKKVASPPSIKKLEESRRKMVLAEAEGKQEPKLQPRYLDLDTKPKSRFTPEKLEELRMQVAEFEPDVEEAEEALYTPAKEGEYTKEMESTVSYEPSSYEIGGYSPEDFDTETGELIKKEEKEEKTIKTT